MPNFLLIGAPKCGTTSIYHYLKQHPQVFMSPVKEPHYFSWQDLPEEIRRLNDGITTTLVDYQALFAAVKDETAIGEASTSYYHREGAAKRIYQALPDVKLIAVLRNPIERAFSGYLMALRAGTDKRSMQEALGPSTTPTQSRPHIRAGFYTMHLARFFDLFLPEQIRLFLYDDLRVNPSGLMQEMYCFLKVDSTFQPEVTTRYNESAMPVSVEAYRFLSRDNTLKQRIKPFIPPSIRKMLTRLSLKAISIRTPSQPIEIRAYLLEVYRDEIKRVEALVDRDLSDWFTL